jgi:hypothetical protein
MTKRILAAAVLVALFLPGCSRERFEPLPPGLHKRAAGAITYFLDRDASDAIELAVRESFQLWSDATIFKFSYGGKAPGRIARDGRNQVVLMTHWPKELSIGEASWSRVYLDAPGNIVEADILLNAQAFSFTTKREAKAGSLYIEEVLAKEIGRSLGIGLGEETGERYHPAQAGELFEPGIDPAEMAAYLSLYEAGKAP